MNDFHSRRALIIGCSLAGLWTARVLADHFAEVIVLERDRLPTTPTSRPGVPQDKHVHVVLARGMQIMSDLFPGIEEELTAAGAVHVNLSRDSCTKMRGAWLQRFPGPNETYACSRILLESILRRRVNLLPNVEIREQSRVEGLMAEGETVTGAQLRSLVDQEDIIELQADFVVDASGRTSRAPDWLAAIGYERPTETVINAHVGYAGRRYRKPADFQDDWHIMLVGAEPPHKSRQGVIFEEEDGVWMVMLAGVMQDYPPLTDEEYLAYAKTVEPAFHAAIREAEPLTNIFGYRRTENCFRHYESLPRWPERFVVLGDAACGFNPIYGQGITVSAVTAVALGEELARVGQQLDGVARRFQQRLPQLVEPAWLLATGADIEWLGRPEQQSLRDRVSRWYLPKLLDAMPYDRQVHLAFSAVQHLVKPPIALFHPGIVLRVVSHWMRTRGNQSASTPEGTQVGTLSNRAH